MTTALAATMPNDDADLPAVVKSLRLALQPGMSNGPADPVVTILRCHEQP